jgi:hypothetical protein
MAARKYEFMVGQHGYRVDLRTLESIPGSDTKPELVTAIDARDVEPLVTTLREIAEDFPDSPLQRKCDAALAPFDSEER